MFLPHQNVPLRSYMWRLVQVCRSPLNHVLFDHAELPGQRVMHLLSYRSEKIAFNDPGDIIYYPLQSQFLRQSAILCHSLLSSYLVRDLEVRMSLRHDDQLMLVWALSQFVQVIRIQVLKM